VSISFISFQCKKDSTNPINLLPPATSTGANTFGCLSNGMLLMPRDGVPVLGNPFPYKGIEPVFTGNNTLDINVYNARDNASSGGFFLELHTVFYTYIKPGDYVWKQSNYGVGTDPYPLYNVYGSLYDNTTKNYAWFGSYDGSGTTTITRIDTANNIISGTFSGKLRIREGTEEITITNGRFDINVVTVLNKVFP